MQNYGSNRGRQGGNRDRQGGSSRGHQGGGDRSGNIFYLVPEDVRRCGVKPEDITNYHLKLNKYAVMKDGKFKVEDHLALPNISHDRYSFENVSKKLEKERVAIGESFASRGYSVAESTMALDWRMVVGLGGESVYEVSMTLHHIYGIPYIPGSSIKGAVRSYLIDKFFAKYRSDTREEFYQKLDEYNSAIDNEDSKVDVEFQDRVDMAEEFAMQADPLFINMFGNHENAAKVVFFDAYPVSTKEYSFTESSLDIDIMNNHYQDYYQDDGREGGLPPADYYSPNPVKFITLKRTAFTFMVAVQNGYNDIKGVRTLMDTQGSSCLSSLTSRYLANTLNDFGVGAKTSVGYGHFQEIDKNKK